MFTAADCDTIYHGYCKHQSKAAFIILQHMHGYSKIHAHHYIYQE
jgi:hypothetical protein